MSFVKVILVIYTTYKGVISGRLSINPDDPTENIHNTPVHNTRHTADVAAVRLDRSMDDTNQGDAALSALARMSHHSSLLRCGKPGVTLDGDYCRIVNLNHCTLCNCCRQNDKWIILVQRFRQMYTWSMQYWGPSEMNYFTVSG